MEVILAALVLLIVSGMFAGLTARRPRLSTLFGAGGAAVGCAAGFVSALQALAGGATSTIQLPWHVPYGSFAIALDPLSAWFILPIFGLSGLAGVYGAEYLRQYQGRKSTGAQWFFYNALAASMVLVVLARNSVLFLVAWEVMSLASYFLVTFDDDREETRAAGWTYLVATHLGTAFLLAFFVLLGGNDGSLDFAASSADTIQESSRRDVLFLLALVGFGTKAGLMPLHIWLPEAHPAAPSHVSAVMSGAMVKVGIYGLIRALTLFPARAAWWGWVLIGAGMVSGIWGVLFAVAQHDLKRMLAYSTVENVGIIVLAIGVGLLGVSSGSNAVAVLGFAGALLHVVNHALFKGLLFLGAGSVAHATGTRDLNLQGGLLKRMPWVGFPFIVGACAIVGLPPLNGFASEFLIYLGALNGEVSFAAARAVPCLLVIGSLGLIGGLAAIGFTKVVGMAFLGEPRTERAATAHSPRWLMIAPQVVLGAGCLVLGLGAPYILPVLAPIAAGVARLAPPSLPTVVAEVTRPLVSVTSAAIALIALATLLALLRRLILRGRSVQYAGTWDCGYARPTSRMQYTASSYVQPATAFFAPLLRSRSRPAAPRGFFPRETTFGTETPDLCKEAVYRPVFAAVIAAAARLRWLQHGRTNIYILYISLTMIALLVWYLTVVVSTL
jgi:formate hydrogenlyase subunit 3/multisubunit Na+/H+ antiporter MnhD subunit